MFVGPKLLQTVGLCLPSIQVRVNLEINELIVYKPNYCRAFKFTQKKAVLNHPKELTCPACPTVR